MRMETISMAVKFFGSKANLARNLMKPIYVEKTYDIKFLSKQTLLDKVYRCARMPSVEFALDIEYATKGHVKAEDILKEKFEFLKKNSDSKLDAKLNKELDKLDRLRNGK